MVSSIAFIYYFIFFPLIIIWDYVIESIFWYNQVHFPTFNPSLQPFQHMASLSQTYHITNLTFHDLVMEIMRNSFIHRFILHLSTHLFLCQTCFQHMIFTCKCMNLWMNEFHSMILIINSMYVKFVMQVS
jgi:hypothetical protein